MNDQQRAAMQMALEALIANLRGTSGRFPLTNEAITALREALNTRSSSTHSDAEYSEVAQPKDHSEQHLNMVQGEPVAYVTEHQNLLLDGLTIIQTNPDCAVQLNAGRDFGWLYMKGAEGQWVTHRKLSPEEINEAQDQAADMVVVKRESVLEKMFEQPIAAPQVVPQGEPVACWLYRRNNDEAFGIALEKENIPDDAYDINPLYTTPFPKEQK